MLKTGFYEFATYEEILLIGLVALVLVLRNWWDLIRYGLARTASAAATPTLAPKLSVRLPRALRALRRGQNRRRIHRSIRHAV